MTVKQQKMPSRKQRGRALQAAERKQCTQGEIVRVGRGKVRQGDTWRLENPASNKADSADLGTGFAESTAGEPHEATHSHLQQIYEGTGLEEWNIEGHTEQQVEPFTMRELEEATARGKLGKSVGPDGIPRKLLIQVVGSSCYRGAEVLGMAQLHTGNRRLAQDWSAVIMVRHQHAPEQVARRLTTYLWCIGHLSLKGNGNWTAACKIGPSRRKLYGMLKQRLGCIRVTRCWRALLDSTAAFLQPTWNCSTFTMNSRIKQGKKRVPIYSHL